SPAPSRWWASTLLLIVELLVVLGASRRGRSSGARGPRSRAGARRGPGGAGRAPPQAPLTLALRLLLDGQARPRHRLQTVVLDRLARQGRVAAGAPPPPPGRTSALLSLGPAG